jgi:hypothetical protein
MQKVACDANAIKKLAEIILKPKSRNPSQFDEFSVSLHHMDKLKEVSFSKNISDQVGFMRDCRNHTLQR